MTSSGHSHASGHRTGPLGRRGSTSGLGDGPVQPVRRRDRRGRGPRGPLMPSTMPAYRTRAERFDDLVLDAVERLERRWTRQLDGTEFAEIGRAHV